MGCELQDTGPGSAPAHRTVEVGATGAVVHLEVAAGAVVGSEGAVVEVAVVADAVAASSAALMTTGPVSAPTPVAVMVAAAAAVVSEAVAEVGFVLL